MKLIEHAKQGWLNLYFSKLRSCLALLGVLVGTASVVAMVLGGELATHEALKQFKSLGTDLLALSVINTQDEAAINNKSDQLDVMPVLQLSKAHSSVLQAAPYTQLFQPLLYSHQTLNGNILGVTEDLAEILQLNMAQGRFISLLDKYAFYCVIGQEVYQELQRLSVEPVLGQQIQIGKQVFTIVGVLQPWPENSFIYTNINHAVLIPILTSTLLSKYAQINNILIRLAPETDINEAQEKITAYFNQVVSKKQISYRSAKELIIKMQKQSDILTVFLGLIGSISLVVGGIGVMNIMLVSVVERRREIGVRLAVGARQIDISLLFLVEAVMLSLLGGIVGVLLGILIAYVIALTQDWEFTLFWWPPIAGFSVSVAVGIFFGFYPAYLAAKLNPIDALKTE